MKTQHTTEKWCAYNCRGIKTFKSWRVHDGTEKQNLICTLPDVDGAMGRAFLIEAAPQLLKALKDTLRYCVTTGGMKDKGKGRTREQQEALDNATAAIALATGGEQ